MNLSVNLKFILLLQVVGLIVGEIFAVEEDFEKIEKSVNHFASDIFNQAIKQDNDKGNVFLSPWSIYSALNLALTATQGETNHQILKGLSLDSLRDNFNSSRLHDLLGLWQRHQIAQDEIESSQNGSGVILSLANRAFVEKSFNLKKDFVDLLKKSYDSEVDEEDFKTKANEAREAINKWVGQQTHDKIKDLLSKDMVTSLTRMILINAVYFKGEWLVKFDKADTTAHGFQCLKSSAQNSVQMMTRDDMFQMATLDDLKARILWIPFSDNQTKIAIILPNEVDGLPEMEKKLFADNEKLFNILNTVDKQKRNVVVKMPRLKIESSFSLKDILQKEPFNIKDIFDKDKADFTPMTSQKELAVSDLIHKAMFEMNEEGATAAAATSSNIYRITALEPEIEEFIVDHPFLMMLLSEHHTPLFMGRVVCVDS